MNSHATGWISHYKQHNVEIYSTSAPKLIVKTTPGISKIVFIIINHCKPDRPTFFLPLTQSGFMETIITM